MFENSFFSSLKNISPNSNLKLNFILFKKLSLITILFIENSMQYLAEQKNIHSNKESLSSSSVISFTLYSIK